MSELLSNDTGERDVSAAGGSGREFERRHYPDAVPLSVLWAGSYVKDVRAGEQSKVALPLRAGWKFGSVVHGKVGLVMRLFSALLSWLRNDQKSDGVRALKTPDETDLLKMQPDPWEKYRLSQRPKRERGFEADITYACESWSDEKYFCVYCEQLITAEPDDVVFRRCSDGCIYDGLSCAERPTRNKRFVMSEDYISYPGNWTIEDPPLEWELIDWPAHCEHHNGANPCLECFNKNGAEHDVTSRRSQLQRANAETTQATNKL